MHADLEGGQLPLVPAGGEDGRVRLLADPVGGPHVVAPALPAEHLAEPGVGGAGALVGRVDDVDLDVELGALFLGRGHAQRQGDRPEVGARTAFEVPEVGVLPGLAQGLADLVAGQRADHGEVLQGLAGPAQSLVDAGRPAHPLHDRAGREEAEDDEGGAGGDVVADDVAEDVQEADRHRDAEGDHHVGVAQHPGHEAFQPPDLCCHERIPSPAPAFDGRDPPAAPPERLRVGEQRPRVRRFTPGGRDGVRRRRAPAAGRAAAPRSGPGARRGP